MKVNTQLKLCTIVLMCLSAVSICRAQQTGSDIDPGVKPPEVALDPSWRLADTAFKNYDKKRYAEAQADIESAIKLRPDELRYHMLLVYVLQKQGKNSEANQAIDQALNNGLDSPELRAAQLNLRAPAPASASAQNLTDAQLPGAQPTASFKRGFPIAKQGFDEYNLGDTVNAAKHGEQAFRIDPSQGIWALLWVNALEAQGKFIEAETAATTSLDMGAPNKTDLLAKRQALRKLIADQPASDAYQALTDGKTAEAVKLARKAVILSPDTASMRLLLVTALLRDGQLAEAETETTHSLEQDTDDTAALVMRGYLRQLQGKSKMADEDFDQALTQDWLSDDQRRNVRLIAADAALAQGASKRVDELLKPLGSKDEAANKRLQQVGSPAATQLTQINYPPPAQECHDTPYDTACELIPDDAAVAVGPAALAYVAYAKQDYQQAITQARLASEQEPDNTDYQKLLTNTLAAGNTTQAGEAMVRVNTELAKEPENAELLMQRGYVNQKLGQYPQALDDFRAARATGRAAPTVILDIGYSQSAEGDKNAAVDTFKEAIDLNDAGVLPLTPAERFETRSAIADQSREWGGYLSAGYRGARPASTGFSGAAVTVPGDAVFSTAELFWRPKGFLNTSTQVFDVYGRFSNTSYDGGSQTNSQTIQDPCGTGSITVNSESNGGLSGLPTSLASLGIRFTPSTAVGLTFGIERQFLIGSSTRGGAVIPESAVQQCALNAKNQAAQYQSKAGDGGWMTYVTYGLYDGTELRMGKSDWFTLEAYVQAGYAWQDMSSQLTVSDISTGSEIQSSSGRLKREQTFTAGEIRIGRSFRLDSISDKLVFFPYLVAGGDWLSTSNRVSGMNVAGLDDISLQGNGSTWALGVGPGFNFRYWFNEDHYNAPRSYLDATVQYRFNVGGGQADRAKGLFLNLTFAF